MSDPHSHGHASGPNTGSYKLAAVGIALVIILYLVLAYMGIPQKWTQEKVEHEHNAHAPAAAMETPVVETPAADVSATDAAPVEAKLETEVKTAPAPAATESKTAPPVEIPTTSETKTISVTPELPAATTPAVETAPPAAAPAATETENAPASEILLESVTMSTTEPALAHDAHDAHDAHHDHAAHGDHGEATDVHLPPYFMILPFAALLLCIALLPLIPATEHWWESNLHRFYVAAGLGIITLLYYGFMHPGVIDNHWPYHCLSDATATSKMWTVFSNAIISEFIPFIVLLFALFSIAGGIRIEGNLAAKPGTNTIMIAIGALLASFIGTTGAAMLLIRPLLETNRERKIKVHTVVFFIFAVCNCGGCLLPTGDPPLFLGYLAGVDFLWTMNLWREWLFVNALLLAVYYAWDSFYAYPREAKEDIQKDNTETASLKFKGLFPNVLLLIGVVLAVALLDPSKTLPGTTWHPWMFLREIVQLGLVFISLIWVTSTPLRVANNFNFGAIIEVAALFFGIFLTMQVPLQILNEQGDKLGLHSGQHFYWSTGSLSAVLDNAPTYVVFSTAAKKVTIEDEKAGKIVTYQHGDNAAREAAEKKVAELNAANPSGNVEAVETEAGINTKLLVAVSLGAVFMGAMTYIGNGPNFMVKAIAEQEGIKMPSFFGYMGYSFAILLPILLIMTFIFL